MVFFFWKNPFYMQEYFQSADQRDGKEKLHTCISGTRPFDNCRRPDSNGYAQYKERIHTRTSTGHERASLDEYQIDRGEERITSRRERRRMMTKITSRLSSDKLGEGLYAYWFRNSVVLIIRLFLPVFSRWGVFLDGFFFKKQKRGGRTLISRYITI